MQNLSTTFWVGVAFVIFGAFSFAFNLWRDRRNRRFDQTERTQQAAQFQQQLREQTAITKTETAEIATKVEQQLREQTEIVKTETSEIASKVEQQLREQTEIVKTETAEIATKVEQALHQQQSASDIQLTKQSSAVEAVLRNQEIATRPDVNSGTAKILDALDVVTEKADAAYREANTINHKLEEMSKAGLIKMDESDIDSIEKNK